MKKLLKIILFLLLFPVNYIAIVFLSKFLPQPYVRLEHLRLIENIEILFFNLLFFLIEYNLFKKLFGKPSFRITIILLFIWVALVSVIMII